MNPIFTLSVCAAISYSPTFLSLLLSSLSVVCVCVNISRRQTTRRKRNKKRTWLFHEMVNLMGIDSRLASQPAGNDFHLSAVPEFWWKPVFDSSKKKRQTRDSSNYHFSYQRRPYSTVCFEICIESKMMTIPLVSSCQRTFRFPPETWDENPRESRH